MVEYHSLRHSCQWMLTRFGSEDMKSQTGEKSSSPSSKHTDSRCVSFVMTWMSSVFSQLEGEFGFGSAGLSFCSGACCVAPNASLRRGACYRNVEYETQRCIPLLVEDLKGFSF